MKYYETHFEEYLGENQRVNLHPKLEKVFDKFPKTLYELKNILFYGPQGVGKYTQMLKSIQKYSPSELKYEKKITVTFNKEQYFFKISDIHYEVDMGLLGCNSKLLWHEIYLQILDILSAKTEKSGIIVCKNFHEIHSELLENFYSYMQQNNSLFVDVKFILLTEELSFIPDTILQSCFIISVPRPTKANYTRILSTKGIHNCLTPLETISNIKFLPLQNEEILTNYKMICNKILTNMKNPKDLDFLRFRDVLYDIFIYHLDISDCIWYILIELMKENKIQKVHLPELLKQTYCFFQYYNNNYRPIYHLEKYLYTILSFYM
jgi:hypothetical protein